MDKETETKQIHITEARRNWKFDLGSTFASTALIVSPLFDAIFDKSKSVTASLKSSYLTKEGWAENVVIGALGTAIFMAINAMRGAYRKETKEISVVVPKGTVLPGETAPVEVSDNHFQNKELFRREQHSTDTQIGV